jgi:hypothetical protein
MASKNKEIKYLVQWDYDNSNYQIYSIEVNEGEDYIWLDIDGAAGFYTVYDAPEDAINKRLESARNEATRYTETLNKFLSGEMKVKGY